MTMTTTAEITATPGAVTIAFSGDPIYGESVITIPVAHVTSVTLGEHVNINRDGDGAITLSAIDDRAVVVMSVNGVKPTDNRHLCDLLGALVAR